MSVLENLIKYFAKYPLKSGVTDNFKSSKDPIEGYDELKVYIEALPAGLQPDIEEFVFSTDETVLADKLKNKKGYFLLLEYGAFDVAKGYAGGRSSDISLSITVGHPQNPKNTDIILESLRMDKCLALLVAIIEQMEADNFEFCGSSKLMDGNMNIAPIEPVLLYNNMGWVLSFKKNENLL